MIDKIISDGIKSSSYLSLEPYRPSWPRGGMVTQRIANPCIPVRFWAWPPRNLLFFFLKKVCCLYSSVAQLVEQLTVNQLVAGSSPARGANLPGLF